MSATHDPSARYCTEIVGIPMSELRDDLTCPACDEGIGLMMLDPDIEVLAPPAHLKSKSLRIAVYISRESATKAVEAIEEAFMDEDIDWDLNVSDDDRS